MPLYFYIEICLCHFHKYFFSCQINGSVSFSLIFSLSHSISRGGGKSNESRKKKYNLKKLSFCENDSAAIYKSLHCWMTDVFCTQHVHFYGKKSAILYIQLFLWTKKLFHWKLNENICKCCDDWNVLSLYMTFWWIITQFIAVKGFQQRISCFHYDFL